MDCWFVREGLEELGGERDMLLFVVETGSGD